MVTRIQLRRDTATNWATNNPTLALGEMGIEIDTRKFKFGDGSTAWNSLAYGKADADNLPTKLSDLENDEGFVTMEDVGGQFQEQLVSGENIKSVNDVTILGSGNLQTAANVAPVWNFSSDYQEELDRVVTKVRGYQNDKSKFNVSFIIFTDCHAEWNGSHPEFERMLQAANYLTWNLDIKFVANLGDTITRLTNEGAMDVYTRLINGEKTFKSPYANLCGNHDYVPFNYRRNYLTNIPEVKMDKYGTWFYLDDDYHGIRYIFLECQDRGDDAINWTSLTTEATTVADRTWLQLDWLANKALKTDKKVITFGHQSVACTQKDTVLIEKNDTTNYYLAKTLLRAFENGESGSIAYTQIFPESSAKDKITYDFSEQGPGRYLCAFNGHTHADLDWSYSGIQAYPTPFNEIWVDDALTNTAYGIGDDNPKTIDTINEIAFDVMTIDLINEKVYCTRVGTGPDRELTLRTPIVYNELDYIAGTGIQYIDTGYKYTNSKHKVEITFSDAVLGPDTPSWLTGSIDSSGNRFGLAVQPSGDKIGIGLGTEKAGTTSFIVDNPGSTKTTLVLEADDSTHKFSYTGGSTEYVDTTYSGNSTNNFNEYIFAVNQIGNATFKPFTMKLYSYKMWDGDKLVRNFIPVELSTGEVGLYDLVESKFYDNAGSGKFVPGYYGVTGYTQLEYIKSTGTQVIDTQYIFTNASHQYETTLSNVGMSSDTGTSHWICGSVVASNGARCGGLAVQSSGTHKVACGVGDNIRAGSTTYTVDPVGATPSTITISTNNTNHTFTLTDGTTTYTDASYTGTNLTGSNEILFAVNDSNVVSYHVVCEMHGLKMTDGEKLVRNFIPVKDNKNEACLYDLVTKLYFRNIGTGNFVAGPESNE